PTCSTWTWPSIPPPALPLFPHPSGLLFERQESLLGGGFCNAKPAEGALTPVLLACSLCCFYCYFL
ncbi:hypothetical protein M9458_042191, partial [Cirrhinus mrigala]